MRWDLILDADSPNNEILTEEQHELVESAAEMLYGLIHVRYILTSRGMGAMFEKFKNCEFGRCPRVHCNGQPCLPIGTSDVPRQATVKIFCPKCCDIYYPRSKYQARPASFLFFCLCHAVCCGSPAPSICGKAVCLVPWCPASRLARLPSLCSVVVMRWVLKPVPGSLASALSLRAVASPIPKP